MVSNVLNLLTQQERCLFDVAFQSNEKATKDTPQRIYLAQVSDARTPLRGAMYSVNISDQKFLQSLKVILGLQHLQPSLLGKFLGSALIPNGPLVTSTIPGQLFTEKSSFDFYGYRNWG